MNDDGGIHRCHIAARRAVLDELIQCLEGGLSGSATLSADQCLAALRVLKCVHDGNDARDYFEIRHKPGSVSRFAARDKFITLYYLLLTVDQPTVQAKQHLATVATAIGWEGDEATKRVGRIISKRRREMTPCVPTVTASQVLSVLQILLAKHIVP
jgi:hypothetical protein